MDRLQSSIQNEQGLVANNHSNITQNHYHGQPPQRPRSLAESLYFPEMARREHSVANAHRQTGQWFLRSKQYVDWEVGQQLTPETRRSCGDLPASTSSSAGQWQNRLLWVKGNAGAGKSTLLKIAVEYAREMYTDALILPHFFNARGTALERSTEGMYRTLIHWLLQIPPRNLETELDPHGMHARTLTWEVPQLTRLLRAAMKKMANRSVIFYIDALDECNRHEVGEMLEVFRNLVEDACQSRREVRVCFASRPYPHHTFDYDIYLDLGEQEQHMEDIAEYIKNRLYKGIGQSIQKEVRRKAAGVFMWAVLVVDMLNTEYDDGGVNGLEALVERVPPGLYSLYSQNLERHPGDQGAMLECFRWLLFNLSDFAFTIGRMWWGVQLGLRRSDEEIRRDYEALSKADMRRYIVRISKGLVEFKLNEILNAEYAQFIHESAREFVLDKQGTMLELYGVRTRDGLEAQSYQRLRDSFFNEVAARRPQLLNFVETKGRDGITDAVVARMGWNWWQRDGTKLPFPIAAFAALHMMWMAEKAHQCGVDQTDFLDTLFPRGGPYFFVVAEVQPVVLGSLINLLLCADCPTLIRDTQREAIRRALQSGHPFGLMEDKSSFSPVSLALDEEQWDSIAALVELYLQSEPRHPQLQQILQQLADTWEVSGPSYNYQRSGPLLDVAHRASRLATFFLIALVVPQKLEPHLNPLQQLVARFSSRPRSLLTFLHTLHLLVEEQLPFTAIDVMRRHTMRWLEEDWEDSEEEEDLEEEEEHEKRQKAREEEKVIRRRVAALLEARRPKSRLPLN